MDGGAKNQKEALETSLGPGIPLLFRSVKHGNKLIFIAGKAHMWNL